MLRLDKPVLELVILNEGHKVELSYAMVRTFLLNQGRFLLKPKSHLTGFGSPLKIVVYADLYSVCWPMGEWIQ